MAVLGAVHYKVRVYSRAVKPRLYSPLNDRLGGGLSLLFRLPPTLFGFMRHFEIEKAVRGIRYSV